MYNTITSEILTRDNIGRINLDRYLGEYRNGNRKELPSEEINIVDSLVKLSLDRFFKKHFSLRTISDGFTIGNTYSSPYGTYQIKWISSNMRFYQYEVLIYPLFQEYKYLSAFQFKSTDNHKTVIKINDSSLKLYSKNTNLNFTNKVDKYIGLYAFNLNIIMNIMKEFNEEYIDRYNFNI